nr:hypothetical protein [Tanacetum cinerariifolium]
MDQNIDFSGSEQIQTPHYPDIYLLSQETSDEVFQANHSIQNEESFENPSSEIVVSNPNQEKEEPPKDFDIHQLIEECSTEVSEKQKMEDTMLNALNSKLLLINSNSQRLDKKEQEVKNVVEQPAGHGNRSIRSLQNFKVVYKSSISFKNTSQISSIHTVAPILSTKEPEHLSKASLFNPEIVSIEEENVVHQEEEEVDLEDISQIQDVVLREKLLSITRLITILLPIMRRGNTTHADNSLPEYDSFYFEIELDQERLINLVENDILDDSSNDSLLEEVDLFLFDNSIPPGIENFADDPEGDVRFLEELLIDDSILSHESFDSNFEENPSIPRPPPEPPDAQTDAGEETLVTMNDKDVDYSSFIFMFDKVFSFLSAESEDTIFDP